MCTYMHTRHISIYIYTQWFSTINMPDIVNKYRHTVSCPTRLHPCYLTFEIADGRKHKRSRAHVHGTLAVTLITLTFAVTLTNANPCSDTDPNPNLGGDNLELLFSAPPFLLG